MSRRTDRVQDLLRLEISQVLLTQVRDPRIHMTSVTTVDMSPDFKRAIVSLSVLGDQEARHGALAAARHARSYIRGALARRLRNMRAIPELFFELDRGAEYSEQIEAILEDLKTDE